jgi:hypothetical protein
LPHAPTRREADPLRRLLATRRVIPLDRIDEYSMAWRRIRDAVVAAGGRAWLFRGAGHDDHFLEFIEWSDGDSGPSFVEHGEVAAARTAIEEQLGGGHADEWEEAGDP